MTVIWTPRAALDLDEMVDYIGEDSPASAIRVVDRIHHQVMQLTTMPHTGRNGKILGTREAILHPWPYIVVYKITDDAIRIIRVRHASRQWP